MVQSATIYRISAKDFESLKTAPRDFDLFACDKQHETFQKDFDGLVYVLTKNGDRGEAYLIKQIFYPDAYLGNGYNHIPNYLEEAISSELKISSELTNNTDYDEEDFERFEGAVYYLTPEKIHLIQAYLQDIEAKHIDQNYDSNAMNALGIYPEVWHDEESRDYGFNRTQLKDDLQYLKAIFTAANLENDYLLIFIG